MKSTRDQLLELLRQYDELTVTELATQLGIAGPAVRRHLDILTGEALVEYRTVKQHTGRPYFVYYRTERARERESTGYPRLLERLLHELDALDEDGAAGRKLGELLLERMSDHLAEEHRGQITGATLEERVTSLVTALHDEGILDDFEAREDGLHLINLSCPYRRAALANTALCQAEQRTISLLLDEDVHQIGRIADGQSRCEYVVGTRSLVNLPVLECGSAEPDSVRPLNIC
jgi:predicted ArsR family transcriptional regulator